MASARRPRRVFFVLAGILALVAALLGWRLLDDDSAWGSMVYFPFFVGAVVFALALAVLGAASEMRRRKGDPS